MRAAEVTLTGEQRTTLRSWLAAGKTEWRLAFRAQIILALADGLTNKEAAGRLATRPATVSKWRGRFARHGLAGVADAPRSGKPSHYAGQDERRILGALAGASQEYPFSLHPDPRLLAQPSRSLVFHPLQPRLGRRQLHLPPAGARSDRRFHYRIQSGRSPLRVDQAGRLLETPAIVIR